MLPLGRGLWLLLRRWFCDDTSFINSANVVVAGMGFALIALLTIYGGVVSRIHGTDFLPRWARNALWVAPIGVISASFYDWPIAIFIAAAVTISCWLGKTTGHGNFFNIGDHDDIGQERLEFLISWTKRYIGPNYIYNFLGMSVVGLASVLGAALAIGYIDLLAGLAVAIGGLAKGAVYVIGGLVEPWLIRANLPHLKSKTNFGEFFSGIFAFVGLSLALWMQ